MQRFHSRHRNNNRNANVPEFPYKRNNYPDYIAKAKSCFDYLKNLQWNSSERLVINNEPIHVKNLSRMTVDDFSFTCPSDITNKEVTIPETGPIFITIKSVDTDYENMNIFTDLFIEYARMEANVIGKMAPIDFWKRNYHKIKNAVVLDGDQLTNHNLREMQYKMFANGRGECTTFRPAILFTILKMFEAKTMLDPCSGWGDRLFACLAAELDLYVGVDPNKRLIQGYNEIRDIFDPNKEKTAMVSKGFEDFELTDIPERIRIEKFDMVFTSPPYEGMEIYSKDPTQSIEKFQGESNWVRGFLFVLFDKSVKFVKIGGHVILNIEMMDGRHTYVYQLIDYAKSMPEKVQYCQMLTYQGSRHSAHCAIFVFKVIGE